MENPNKRRANDLAIMRNTLKSNLCNNRPEARLAIKSAMAGTYMAGQNVGMRLVPYPSSSNGVFKATDVDFGAIDEFIENVGSSNDDLLTAMANDWFLMYDEPPRI
ncbi:hypothetical protein HU759_017955 [Pseudomonas sp. OE 28.3]|uniref:hypothetical protein n=1 Tax=Pseudomonas sp. OE 28.3 TaxID=2745519 RepID=UPI00164973B2|nr:hypothetical protein [Pseudomonas sp. OE 28.3]QXI56992.1 hypothetical protein HU759_017955 [Pseudomonas sp. OE 28.3]